MAHDFKQYLKIPTADATPLHHELEDAEWARYGRNIQLLINTDRFTEALTTCALRAKDQKDNARRLRIFLTTGVIPS